MTAAVRGMALALRLARRELRGGLKGFRIFLACLTLGVAAIAAVGSVSESMLAGLRAEGRSLLGGDLDLRLTHREAEPDEHAWLTARGELSIATHMRSMARDPAPDGRRLLVELRGLDQLYPLYGAVRLQPSQPLDQALALRDGQWGAAVERRVLRRLDLAVGDSVALGSGSYQIRAVVEHEPDRTTQGFILSPSFMVARDSLAATGLVQPGSLIHYHYRLRVAPGGSAPGESAPGESAPGESAVDLKAAAEAAFPDAGWRVRGPLEASPGTRRFIERLALFLTLVGLTSLLVGGVAVGNAVRSYLEEKTATIATLKCLGATGDLVFQVYLIQVMALALVAIAGGLVIGGAAPPVVSLLLGDKLGWSAAGGIYPVPLAVASLFGILTTLAFSLWPLAHARAVPAAALFRDLVAPVSGPVGVRVWLAIAGAGALLAALAIATAADKWLAIYFVAGAAGALAVFRAAGLLVTRLARRAARPRHPGLRLAIANLHRPGAPTLGVVMSLGLGLTVLVAIALIEGNLARQVERSLPEQAPSFYFIDIQPDQVEAFDQTVAAVPGIQELRRVPMLRGRITAVDGTATKDLTIPQEIDWVFRGDRGLTWSREPVADAELTAGDWWPPDYDGEPLVSLDSEVGELLGLAPGDTLTINLLGRSFQVTIANLRVIDWSNLTINFVMVFSPGLLESAPQSAIATVKAATPEAEDAVERAVTDRFANVSAIRVKEALETIGGLIADIAMALRATAAVALVSGVLVLAGAVAAGHHRRVYDAVVMKVLGATRRNLGEAYLMEYGLLGLVTSAIAGVLGTVAAYLVITELMNMSFVFLPGAVVLTALIATVITLSMGFAGTWRALSHKAAPLLRND